MALSKSADAVAGSGLGSGNGLTSHLVLDAAVESFWIRLTLLVESVQRSSLPIKYTRKEVMQREEYGNHAEKKWSVLHANHQSTRSLP